MEVSDCQTGCPAVHRFLVEVEDGCEEEVCLLDGDRTVWVAVGAQIAQLVEIELEGQIVEVAAGIAEPRFEEEAVEAVAVQAVFVAVAGRLWGLRALEDVAVNQHQWHLFQDQFHHGHQHPLELRPD